VPLEGDKVDSGPGRERVAAVKERSQLLKSGLKMDIKIL
jgi:hypothetical protein